MGLGVINGKNGTNGTNGTNETRKPLPEDADDVLIKGRSAA